MEDQSCKLPGSMLAKCASVSRETSSTPPVTIATVSKPKADRAAVNTTQSTVIAPSSEERNARVRVIIFRQIITEFQKIFQFNWALKWRVLDMTEAITCPYRSSVVADAVIESCIDLFLED